MKIFSICSLAFAMIMIFFACSQSERQRLDAALLGDCPTKVAALDKLLPELREPGLKQEAEKALLLCRTELEREKAIKLFEDPEANMDQLLKMQSELKAAGRAGLMENAYSGFISRLFAEGELEKVMRLDELFSKSGLIHPTSTSFARAFINCRHEACYPLSKKVFAKLLARNKYPSAREEFYRIWLEIVLRYGTAEELEEATFVMPCIFEQPSQPMMQLSMEYQLKAADKRRAAAMPDREVGSLDCEAFKSKQAEIAAAEFEFSGNTVEKKAAAAE